MSDVRSEAGVIVVGTLPGSRAEKAGLKKGDRVIAVNDVPVNSLQEVINVLNVDNARSVSLLRGNAYLELVYDPAIPAVDPNTIDYEKLRDML